MPPRALETHYEPNRRLAEVKGLTGYNCGYAQPGDQSFADHQRSLVWRLLGDTAISQDSTVIDIGCGIGGPAEWVVQRYRPRRLIGLEFCRSSVAAAESRCRESTIRPAFLQGDAHRLPFADASADVILCLESALHYADKDAFVGECTRVLRPGARLCLGDITTRHKWLFTPLAILNRLPSQFNSHIYLWSPNDYRAAFQRHGLELLRYEDASRPVARSLANGLTELKRLSQRVLHGMRGRFAFLAFLQFLLTNKYLNYDLFTLRRA